MGLRRGHRPLVGVGEDGVELAAQGGVVAVARHVDQTGDEALERIAAREEGDALPLLQVEDAEGDAVEVVGGDLEQLVARVGLDDVAQVLAVVAVGREAGARDHRLDLLLEERDRERARTVGGGGEEADEEAFAGHLAVAVEALDRHRVHRHRLVHRRDAVRLVDAQEDRRAQELADVGRQGAQVAQAVEDRVALLAQQAEAGLGEDAGDRGVPLPLEAVLTVAEEGVVARGEPFEEADRLVDLALRQARRRVAQLGGDVAAALPHGGEVADRVAHGREHLEDAALDLRRAGGELGIEAHLTAAGLHRAFQHIAHAQFLADGLGVDRLTLEGEGRIAGDHEAVRDMREAGRQFIG